MASAEAAGGGEITEPGWAPGDLILIAGPTGTGKTALSLDLAEALAARSLPAEIVNADAMQLYRGMDIGTAKLPASARRGIPHHLFDVLELTDTSTVHDYQVRARERIEAIRQRGATPVLVGGSGLYISAVIHDFRFPGRDEAIRTRLEKELEDVGAPVMWGRLQERDPLAAQSIGINNGRRIVRALEVIEATGTAYSATLPAAAALWRPTVQFFLDGDREELRRRLRIRAEQMWVDGLVDETRRLLPHGLREATTALRAIGYAQALEVIDGRRTEQEGIDDTEQLTIRYARRQRSWFARYSEMHRLDYLAPDLLAQVLARLGLADR